MGLAWLVPGLESAADQPFAVRAGAAGGAAVAVAFFGNGLASITWSLVSTLAPARLLGLTGGVFNFIGNLSAIATPIVIGFLASGDSFAPAITYISVLALIGALSYILLVGKVERIKL